MTVEGAVEARNDRGIKLGGEWRNMSKFRPVALPEIGAHVRADVDEKGFLKTIEVLDEHTAVTASSSHRDQQIARLAVLKAAAAYAAVRPTMKAADVLTVAQAWLEWVES